MIPFLAGVASSTVGALVTSPITSYIAAQWAPTDYRNKEVSWYNQPIVKPDVGTIIELYVTGRIDGANAEYLLAHYGIFWTWDRATTSQKAFDLSRPGSQLARLLPDEDRRELQQRLISQREYWNTVIDSHKAVPGIDRAIDLFMRGYGNEATLKRRLKRAGANVESWTALTGSMYTRLGVHEVLNLVNRGAINDNEYANLLLRRLGYRQDRQRELLLSLREELPQMADLMLLAKRHMWERGVNRDNQLFTEFPAELQQWANKTGLFGNSDIPDGLAGPGNNATWAEALYAANRPTLGIAESLEAYRRHRANRINRFAAQGVNVQPFTLDRLYDNMKANGYTQRDRETIAALAWQPLPFRYVRTMVQLRAQIDHDPAIAAAVPANLRPSIQAADRQWAIEQLVDLGHHPDDAAIHVDFQTAQVAIKDAQVLTQFAHEEKRKAIHGSLELYADGVSNAAAVQADLAMLGVDEGTTRIAIANVDIAKRHQAVKEVTDQIRHDYDSGILSAPESLAALVAAGINADAARWYVDRWSVMRNHTRRIATSSEVLKWLEQGLIQRQDAITRLANLGYSNADILTELRSAQVVIDHLASRQATAEERSRHQAHQQLVAVAKQADKQQKEAISAARKTLPKHVLLQSLKKGIASPQYVQRTLRAQGYSEDEIDLEIRNALYVKPPKEKSGSPAQTASEPATVSGNTA